ncbi:hypothetical protein AAFC00_005372 [Neodothiora populina]
MTSTATCTVHTVDTYATPSSFSTPFAFSARQTLRTTRSDNSHSRHASARSEKPRSTMSQRNTEPKDGHHSYSRSPSDIASIVAPTPSTTTTTQPWLKRLSTFSTSSSSRQSSPRPVSVCVSPSNGSIALSKTRSTTPILGSQPVAPQSNPPNKLVKRERSMSLHPPSSNTNSKIPKPTLRRPATSHQRSATLQERRTRSIQTAHGTFSSPTYSQPSATKWRTFFTPKVNAGPAPLNRRRNSSSIPNPIRRVYPDRRYTPTLVSAAEPIARAMLEFQDDNSHNSSVRLFSSSARPSSATFEADDDFSVVPARRHVENYSTVEQLSRAEPGSRRSWNIGDWLPSDGQDRIRPFSRNSVSRYWGSRRASATATPKDVPDNSSTWDPDSEPSTVRHHIVQRSTGSDELITAYDFLATPPLQFQDDPLELATVEESNVISTALPRRRSTPLSDFDFDPTRAGGHNEDNEKLDKMNYLDLGSAKAVRSSPGRRGPAIDTIFQESPPPPTHGGHTLLRDILQRGSNQDGGFALRPRHSIIHEEDALSTPARSVRLSSAAPSPLPHSATSPAPDTLSTSPPAMPSLLHLRHKKTFDDTDDDKESSWSFGGDEDELEPVNPASRFAHLGLTPSDLSQISLDVSSPPTTLTPQRQAFRHGNKDTRSSIFDWSEQQPLDRSPGSRSPPRPKTVHGKKDAEHRGSRSVGRRAPSGVHVRSQSVPVAPEVDGARSQVVSNKFGTWGVGSKGVTEDWNEDFDFGDIQPHLPVLSVGDEKRLDSGIGMLVPPAIRAQQTNVLANISLVRDWGLLIEEIKELRLRAMALDLVHHVEEPTWNEVEAMIDLADQESDEHTLAPRYTPSSSPTCDHDAFEESVDVRVSRSVERGSSPRTDRESLPGSPIRSDQEIHIIPATPRRQRKNSEAVARSVIEALQQKRVSSDSRPSLGEGLEKVHFDTATLRRIIPYVQDLRDRVKGILREAEGLYASPPVHDTANDGVRIGSGFREAPDSPSMQTRRSMNTTDGMTSDDGFQSPTEDLAARIRLTAVV